MPTLRYVSIDDLEKIVPESQLQKLTSGDTTGTPFVNDQILKFYLASAEGEVEGYLQKRYQLPIDNVSFRLRHAIVVVAKYNLMLRVGLSKDEYDKEYENVKRWLEDVMEGDANLGLDDNEDQAARQALADGAQGFAVRDATDAEPDEAIFKDEHELFFNYD